MHICNHLIIKKTRGVVLYIVIIAAFKLYYLIALPGTMGMMANDILTSSAAIIAFFYVIISDKKILSIAQMKNFFIVFYSFLFLELIYSSLRYETEPVLDFIKELTPYLVLLSYFVFLKYLKLDERRIVDFIVSSATFISIAFIIQAVLYNTNNTVFLKIYGFQYGKILIDLRNDRIRLLAADLVAYSSFIAMGLIYEPGQNRKKTRKYWLNIIAVILYEIYVTQIRSMAIIIVVSLIIVILKYGANRKESKIIISALAIVAFVTSAQLIYEYIEESIFSVIARTDYSLYHRVDAFSYYLGMSFKHPLTGIGLLREDTSSATYNIIHGNGSSPYGYSDVGFFGVLGKLGITGGIIYLYPIIWQIKAYKKTKSPMIFSILLAFILSIPSSSLFDSGRLIVLAAFLAISEYNLIKYEKETL